MGNDFCSPGALIGSYKSNNCVHCSQRLQKFEPKDEFSWGEYGNSKYKCNICKRELSHFATTYFVCPACKFIVCIDCKGVPDKEKDNKEKNSSKKEGHEACCRNCGLGVNEILINGLCSRCRQLENELNRKRKEIEEQKQRIQEKKKEIQKLEALEEVERKKANQRAADEQRRYLEEKRRKKEKEAEQKRRETEKKALQREAEKKLRRQQEEKEEQERREKEKQERRDRPNVHHVLAPMRYPQLTCYSTPNRPYEVVQPKASVSQPALQVFLPQPYQRGVPLFSKGIK